MSKGLQHTATSYIAKVLMTLACLFTAMTMSGQGKAKYTNESPLRMVCENEFYPFEYRNESGQPEGFDIKVATKILSTLSIPYAISMTTRTEVNEAFDTNNADLIVKAPTNPIPGVYYTKNVSHTTVRYHIGTGTDPRQSYDSLSQGQDSHKEAQRTEA